jgi:autotransporter-associated beta strand protein
VLNPTISDSASGVVHLAKTGAGTWTVNGVNSYSGDTSVQDGVLRITNSYLSDVGDVDVFDGGLFDLDFVGTDTIRSLYFNGVPQLGLGTYGAIGSGADFESSFFSGTGLLGITTLPISGLAGDFNNDGYVDAADYSLWRDNEGAVEGTLENVGEVLGVIGSEHYDLWASNYGATIYAAASTSAVAIPEPHASALLLLALGALIASAEPRTAKESSDSLAA